MLNGKLQSYLTEMTSTSGAFGGKIQKTKRIFSPTYSFRSIFIYNFLSFFPFFITHRTENIHFFLSYFTVSNEQEKAAILIGSLNVFTF